MKNIEVFYPLSPTQQGILFHTLYAPKSDAYVVQTCCTIRGNLNIEALQKAWQKLVDRHSILRTSFVWEGLKEPVQIVRKQVKLPWEQYDWRSQTKAIAIERLEVFLKADRELGFQLSQVPLLRLILIQLDDTEYRLIWSRHHILQDGWSSSILFQEVLAFYKAIACGETLQIETPPPYRNYIVWLQQQKLSVAEKFWRQTLRDFSVPTAIKIDQIPQGIVSEQSSYDEQQIALSTKETTALQSFARQHKLTLNTLIQGAWALLLSRYSGEEDVLFGTVVSGRPPDLVNSESIVGLFVNTLPVRSRVEPDEFLLSWLQKFQTQIAEMKQYEYTPLAEIIRWSEIGRDLPLFESIVSFENYSLDSAEVVRGSNLEISEIRPWAPTHYPLTVQMQIDSKLSVTILFDRQRFSADAIARMLGHFQTLLLGAIDATEKRLKELPMLTEREQQQLLVECNNNQINYFDNLCLHQLFEASVERTPDAIAVVFENQKLTYRELNQQANQLAHYLQDLGVKPDSLVGLCTVASLETIVGILGILKAGGAYVPLDPAHPRDRLAFAIDDASVSVILTQERCLEKLPQGNAKVVCLDKNWQKVANFSVENTVSEVGAENLAYVIYTSGSTGKPKGVLVAHANVVRLFAATQSWYEFSDRDCWTLFHSYAFDFSVWEIWGALIYGGKLVIVPCAVRRSPELFYQLLCEEKVTILNQTPSAFRQLIRAEESLENANTLALRKVIFGGEALELQSLKPWFDRHGDKSPELINMYGITETTVHVTYRPLNCADLNSKASVIGRPILDLQLYILDRNRQPVPIGIPGEMYVGGAGVARGYLNRPELNAEKFISNPYVPGARLYKTGDLARYLSNGDIEYLGRIDEQVKVRGFRIELGEIEAAIAPHPTVREAIVLLREDRPGDKRLVAYVVPKQKTAVTVNQLRDFLKEKLPDYMVPSAFVTLEVLPLTVNGKIDRRSLPAPDTSRPELEEAFAKPRTPEEIILAEIWAEVLKLERVGIRDNFFALGGDSIRSIQVQSLAQKQGLNFAIAELFQHSTIAELAERIKLIKNRVLSEQTKPFSLISEADRLKLPADVEDAYPLAVLQAGMLFHSEYSPDSIMYHNVSSYQLKARFDLEKWQSAIQHIVDRHPVLRTSFDLSNFSEPLQLVSKTVAVVLQVEDLRHLNATEREKTLDTWFEAEMKRKFDWRKAPLLRFHIHRCTEEIFQFSLTEHHAILDGWSVASMLTELLQHYFYLLGEEVSPIKPPPAIAFRDFVALQQKALQSEECRKFWIEKLKDSPRTTLNKKPISQTGEVRVLTVPVSYEVSEALKKLAQSASVPLKNVLFAAHLKAISQLCGQSDVVTILSSNGRPETTDGDRAIGLFLTPLPLRAKLSGGTWIELIQQAFEAERELLPFRWYPMAQIQIDLGDRHLFETCFNFTHFHVYQRLQTFSDLQILGGREFEMTDFVLLADFSVNPLSSQIELFLKCNTSALDSQQIEEIGCEYARTLACLAENPMASYKFFEEEKKKQKEKELENAIAQKLKVAKRKSARNL